MLDFDANGNSTVGLDISSSSLPWDEQNSLNIALLRLVRYTD